jgi:hypothetical protein
MADNDSFKMTYSANAMDEIEKIRSKYVKKDDKLAKLKALDAQSEKKAMIVALTVGIIGTLIFGTGMSLSLSDLGSILGLGDSSFVVGIVVGIIGLVVLAFAYPIYSHTLKAEREKHAEEVIRLADELKKGN